MRRRRDCVRVLVGGLQALVSRKDHMTPNNGVQANVLETVDEFVRCVPWGEHRGVLIYRRQHGGRSYVRLRTWNQHRTKLVWYPTKRFFVIPIENAEQLADAFRAAVGGESEPKPEWLVAREQGETRRVAWLEDVEAPPEVVERARQILRRRRERL